MAYQGDIRLGDTIDFQFTTVSTTGAPTTLAGSPVVSAYIGNSTTQLTAGITLSVDFDGVAGLHNIRVVATSGNGYATATNVGCVVTTGTVGGTSIAGYVAGSFSIENRSALMPTVAARTADVTATGGVGIDWANVEAPTTTLALTGTTIATTQKVDIETIKTNPVVNGGTITFPTTATLASTTNITAGTIATATNVTTVNGLAANVITNASLAADSGLKPIRSNTAQAGAGTTITLDASASAVDNFYNNTLILTTGGTGGGQARFISAYVGATKVATVATWVTNPDNTTTFAILPFDAVAGASAPTAAQNATAVWTDLLAGSDFSTSASIGKLLKDDIDAAVSSRMATYTQPTGFLSATFPAGTVANTTNITAGTVTTATNVTTVNGLAANVITATSIAADAITAAKIATNAIDADAIAADAVTEIQAGLATPTNITAGIITTVTNLTNAPTAGDFTATMKTSIGTAVAASAVASVTGNVGGNVVGSVGSVVGLTASNLDATVSSRATPAQVTTNVQAVMDGTVADSIPADGTRASISSGIYMLTQWLNERAVSGTTVTVKKADGSTTLFTLTLDDGTTPTSITRAT